MNPYKLFTFLVLVIKIIALRDAQTIALKEGDLLTIINETATKHNGLCSVIDNKYVTQSELLCIFNNSTTLKEVNAELKKKVESIISAEIRTNISTSILFDKDDKKNLLFQIDIISENKLPIPDASIPVTNKPNDNIFHFLHVEVPKAINSDNTKSVFSLIICNNFIYRYYLTQIDYYISRMSTKECPLNNCTSPDQDAIVNINAAFNMLAYLFTEEEIKNEKFINTSLDKLVDENIKLLTVVLKKLRDYLELDSAKNNIQNESNCMKNAQSFFNTKDGFNYNLWIYEMPGLIEAAIKVDPIIADEK